MSQNPGGQSPDQQSPDFNPFVPQQQYDPFQQDIPHITVDLTWSEVWEIVISQPSIETFQTILRDVNANTTRGLTWVLIAGFVSGVVNVLAQAVFGLAFLPVGFGNNDVLSFSLICSVILIPISAVLTLIVFLIMALIIHVGASILGGKGQFDALSYSFASFYAPLSIIGSVVGFVPCLGFLAAIGIGFYQLYLSVIAVKTVHGFGWFQATLSVFIIPIALTVLFMCCFILILAPAIGGTFEDIINTLVTPTP
jgi:hypothetical protein